MSQNPLHLLCIEPRFPGRLGPVADWLVRHRGYRCQFYCNTTAPRDLWPASAGHGLEVIRFNVGGVARERSVHWMRQLERSLCYAYGCWEVLSARRPQPVDLVLGRSHGLGSTLFAPVQLPGVPVVQQFSYFNHPHLHDLAETAGPETPVEFFHARRAATALELIELENDVVPWTLTNWQRNLFPAEYSGDFFVLYDGVDTRRFCKGRSASRSVGGRTISPQTRIVSFVASATDRLRGFDRFVQLANRLQEAYPDVLCIAAGNPVVEHGLDIVHYGQNYAEMVLRQTPAYDPERLWILGAVPESVVAELLAASDLHVYPSRPYVVSRSLVQAMSAGCTVLAWDEEPAREFLAHGQTGLLVAPDDADGAFAQARAVLTDPAAHRPLGAAAAELVRDKYAQDVTLPMLAEQFDRLVQRGR